MIESPIARDLRHALDPCAWATEVLEMQLDAWQARMLRSTSRRLLLNCSRQSGKSTITAVLALHRAVFYPRSLIVLVAQDLAKACELFRKVLDHRHHVDMLDDDMPTDSKTACELPNGSRIVTISSKPKNARGYSAPSLVVIDEAAFVLDELYEAVLPSLATAPTARLVLMSTPFGQRGFFHKEWMDAKAAWERIRVTADECPRISKAFLAEMRQKRGDLFFRSEFQCEFTDTIESMFRSEDIDAAMRDDVKPLFGDLGSLFGGSR